MSVSCTLDPKKLSGAPDSELENLKLELERLATVSYRQGMAIVSLICNVEKTSEIMMRVSDFSPRGRGRGRRGAVGHGRGQERAHSFCGAAQCSARSGVGGVHLPHVMS